MESMADAARMAEFVGAAVYMRAILARASADEPEVFSVRFACTFDSPGYSVIEVELVERNGMAIGGFSL